MRKHLFITLVLIAGILAAFHISFEKNNDHLYAMVRSQKEVLQDPDLVKSMARGELLYGDFCMQCHQSDGKGVEGTFPPLAGSDWLIDKRKASIHSIKYGLKGVITVNGVSYSNLMAPMGLSNTEIADIMNYIMNSWGNQQSKMATPEEVAIISK